MKPLEKYKKGSAGIHMTSKIPIVNISQTIADARRLIEEKSKQLEIIDYIYVIDNEGKLKGVFSVKDVHAYNPKIKVTRICKTSLITVKPEDKQDDAAYLSLKYNIAAIPVVDDRRRLLGVISKDKILSILHYKHLEDKFKHAGIHKSHAAFDDISKIPISKSIKHRIFWLLIGLLGGILAAQIIGRFEQTLEKNILIASFIPLIVYLADAVRVQLEAFAVRDFSLFRRVNFTRYFMKQLSIVIAIAFLLGGSTAIISLLIYKNLNISIILGIAVTSAAISSIITGLLTPFIFRKFKSDPANSSGPIGTIIQDLLSVAIYFLIASQLL